MKPWFFISCLMLVLVLAFVGSDTAAVPLSSVLIPTPSPRLDPILTNDIMPALDHPEADQHDVAASDYTVTPILFVPNDLTPNPFALQTIDRQMQLIQRWYAEQLRGTTFTLEPAQIVIGWHPLAYYYDGCYPPGADSSCLWEYTVWDLVWSDMYNHGYPWQENRVRALFFQNDGLAAPGLGSLNQFIIGIYPITTFGDCAEPGCQLKIMEGATAHELGHSFNLGHTAADPEDSPSKALMYLGYANFPRATLVNTSVNPERDLLLASPFFNTQIEVKDGGFEDCLEFWTRTVEAASCLSDAQRSGLSALLLLPNDGQSYQISQVITATGGQAYDFSGWLKITAPAAVGHYDTPHYALEVAITGTHAYVADDDAGLRIIDVVNPTAPTERGFYDTPGSARDVSVQGRYAYLADWFDGLRVIDISNPMTPTQVGAYDTPWAVDGVAVVGDYAYVADGFTGLGVIDISEPTTPTLAGSFYDTPGLALDVAVEGDYAYVADWDHGLRIIDVSDPAALTEIGFYDTSRSAIAVAVKDAYAYVADDMGGLRIIRISNPAVPTQVGVCDTPGRALGVAVTGSYAYIADGDKGLRIVDVSNPATPVEIDAYDTSGQAEGLAVSGGYVYVADGFNGLSVVDTDLDHQANAQIQLQALSQAQSVLSTFVAGHYLTETVGWERFGASAVMPTGTVAARLVITTSGSGPVVYVDDVDFHPAHFMPLAPLPMIHTDGDVMPTLQPVPQWADVTSATSFQLQIATDRHFDEPIIDVMTPSLFYAVSDGLNYNRRYFWRVQGSNGMGQGSWSPTWSFIPRPSDSYYDDEFDSDALRSGWFWVREDQSHWGLGQRPNALAIRTQAGDLSGTTNTAKNLLLREAPPEDFDVSTFVDMPLEANSQQSGLLVYQDDDNYIKIMRVMNNWPRVEVLAEVNGHIVELASRPVLSGLPMRIMRKGNTYTTYYSVDGATWRSLGQPITTNWSDLKIGLTAYNPPGASETTAYFYWFRVKPGCTQIMADILPPGSGSVVQSAGDCDNDLGHSAGFSVTLAANPAPGYKFESWSGDIEGTTNPINITAHQDMTVTAHFMSWRVYLPLVLRSD
jgi:uncharacterized repeat protein (TIGR02543 family)